MAIHPVSCHRMRPTKGITNMSGMEQPRTDIGITAQPLAHVSSWGHPVFPAQDDVTPALGCTLKTVEPLKIGINGRRLSRPWPPLLRSEGIPSSVSPGFAADGCTDDEGDGDTSR